MRNLLTEPEVDSTARSISWRAWLLRHPDLLRYALAPVVVAIALAARIALAPLLGDDAPYLFFVPPVLIAAGLGGWGPGITATALGALSGFLIVAGAAHTDV